MVAKALDLHPGNHACLDLASEIVGRDLHSQFVENAGNDEMFATNRDVQIAVFLTNYMHARALEAQGVRADASLGLSLGEYNHIVDIGALDFTDAVRLVHARGVAYDKGPAGKMASVFPIDLADLEDVVARCRPNGVVEIANYNSPQQYVLSGDGGAVDAAMAILEDELFIQATVIEHRIPMHSTLFEPVACEFRKSLEAAPWRAPVRSYLPNVGGVPIENATAELFCNTLSRHVCRPVKFRQSIDALADAARDEGETIAFVEVGPRGVLASLLKKKWRTEPVFRTDAAAEHVAHFHSTVEEIRRATG
jgi:[acyl-carrier-protein] S-malonyltransferase